MEHIHKLNSTYTRVIASAENTCAPDVSEPSWIVTSSFPLSATLRTVMHWAQMNSITGKLVLPVDESSEVDTRGKE